MSRILKDPCGPCLVGKHENCVSKMDQQLGRISGAGLRIGGPVCPCSHRTTQESITQQSRPVFDPTPKEVDF